MHSVEGSWCARRRRLRVHRTYPRTRASSPPPRESPYHPLPKRGYSSIPGSEDSAKSICFVYVFFSIDSLQWRGDEKPEYCHSVRQWIPAFAGMSGVAHSKRGRVFQQSLVGRVRSSRAVPPAVASVVLMPASGFGHDELQDFLAGYRAHELLRFALQHR